MTHDLRTGEEYCSNCCDNQSDEISSGLAMFRAYAIQNPDTLSHMFLKDDVDCSAEFASTVIEQIENKRISRIEKDEGAIPEVPDAPTGVNRKKKIRGRKAKMQFNPEACSGACCTEVHERGDATGNSIPDDNSVVSWDSMGPDRETGHRKQIMDYEHIGQHESDPRTEESVPVKAATAHNIPIDEPGRKKDAEDGELERKARSNYECFYGLPNGS